MNDMREVYELHEFANHIHRLYGNVPLVEKLHKKAKRLAWILDQKAKGAYWDDGERNTGTDLTKYRKSFWRHRSKADFRADKNPEPKPPKHQFYYTDVTEPTKEYFKKLRQGKAGSP